MIKHEKQFRGILQGICPKENISREGLVDTPKRWIKTMGELCSGYDDDPKKILSTRFNLDDMPTSTVQNSVGDQIILLQNISVFSICEHHLLPFIGKASVAYTPKKGGAVFGISKIARLIECYARRLQLQERLTLQIAESLLTHSKGVLVMVQAEHLCMQMRGVNKQQAKMTTVVGRGIYSAINMEILQLVRDGLN